jgi:hypothetical protein
MSSSTLKKAGTLVLIYLCVLRNVRLDMEIFPAIDLKEGKVVRLHQGDYNKVCHLNFRRWRPLWTSKSRRKKPSRS